MENIIQNQNRLRIIVLSFLSLLIIFATSCGGSSNTTTIPAAPKPTPPPNFFPDVLADFKLSTEPKINDAKSKTCGCLHFESFYEHKDSVGNYGVEIYKSADDARQAFVGKKYLEYTSEVTKQTDSEIIAITKVNGKATVARLAGVNIIIVNGRKDAVVVIENNLPFQVMSIAKPPTRKIENFLETPVIASVMLKDFEKNQAEAIKKYGENFVLVKGKVAEAGDDIEIENVEVKSSTSKTPNPISTPWRTRTIRRIAKSLKPTPTPQTTTRRVEVHHPYVVLEFPAKAGDKPIEVWCYFWSADTEKVLKLKDNEDFFFRGRIVFKDGKLQILEAKIED